MNLEIIRSDYFTKEFKRLAKRYRSLIDDYEAFLDNLRLNPLQGDEIAPHVRKIRMAITSKGRGKSGGDGKIYLLLIYDKADTPNVKMNVIKEIIEELGL